MTQYEQFLSFDNFKLAFDRLKTAHRNLYKSIYYEDLKIFELFLDDNIKLLTINISQNIYTPERCHKIFIPKKDNLVRPLSMLNFIDLLVYQAMVNVIADKAYDVISPYYDNTVFGNIVNPTSESETNRKFFYKSWKKKWKRFNEITKEHFSNGYVYLSEFDIASFFDTIDHNILCELLSNIYHIEPNLLTLLSNCLEVWTEDSNHKTFKSKHGIPQGPISSPLLADLYLFHLDAEIRKIKSIDFRYIRYVDDIRIFSKDELTSQKVIAALDLISRDLGLIPQGSKILIKRITDIDKELKLQNSKFSEITKEYKENNDGKPAGSIKAKTHKILKKRFLDCFKKNSSEVYLDKTVIGFSLYKLNKDDEIKTLLISKYQLIGTHFDGVLYYLKRHYPNDVEVISLIESIIADEDILFTHLIALCFKHFPEIPFNEDVYIKYTFEKHRHWLVNYYMISWLHHNKKHELILSENSSRNYFVQRELNNYKFISSKEKSYRKIFCAKLMEQKNDMIALQGLYLFLNNPVNIFSFVINGDQNRFVNYTFTNQPSDVILFTLKNEWGIENVANFFNRNIWKDDAEYEELKQSFFLFIKTMHSDPSKALLNLNAFNNLIYDKICNRLKIKKPSKDYGVNLNANLINNSFPLCGKYWVEVNEKRNQQTDAHPYDKFGNIRLRITDKELLELKNKQIKTIEEVCNFRGF